MMDESYAHIDLSNHIDNPKNKDTSLGMKFGSSLSYSIKLLVRDKKEILKKYVLPKEGDKKHKMKVIVAVYSFLLYKLIKEVGPTVKNYKLCNDVRPIEKVHSALVLICKFYNEKPFQNQGYKIRSKEPGINSPAHKIASSTSSGRRPADYQIREKDLEELYKIIELNIK